jgi:hypothetical protein
MSPKITDVAQPYTVWLLPVGRSRFTAAPADYKALQVQALNDASARFADEVMTLVRAGTHYVVEARPGSQEAPTFGRAAPADDRDPGLRSPNSATPSGLPHFPTPRAG